MKKFWLRKAILVMCLTCSFFASAAETAKIFNIDLDDSITDLSPLDIRAKRVRGRVILLEDSYIYNFYYSDVISLYRYITLIPGVLDNQVYPGVYNLSFRGANTSPTGIMPFTISVDGSPYLQAYRAPMNVYVLPQISYISGNYIIQQKVESTTGIVDARTHILYKKHSGDFWLNFSNQNQGVWGKVAGPINSGKTNFYGLNFNILNHPGIYLNNLYNKKIIYRKGDKPQKEYLDRQRSLYLNAFANGSVGKTEGKIYATFDHRERGYLNGYMTPVEEFENNPDLKTINASQSSDIDSYNNNQELNLGVLSKSKVNIYDAEFAFVADGFYRMSRKRSLQDLSHWTYNGTNTAPIDEWMLYGQETDDRDIQEINFNFGLFPILTIKAKQFYSVGMNLNVAHHNVYDLSKYIGIGGVPNALFDRGGVLANYKHKVDKTTMEIYGYYKFILNSDNHLSIGGRLKGYRSMFKQRAIFDEQCDATASKMCNFYIEAINARLIQVGSPELKEGKPKFQGEYNDTMFLPKVLWESIFRGGNGRYNLIHVQYYMSFIPGGFNPYILRENVQLDERKFSPEVHHNAEIGLKSRFFEGKAKTRLTFFYKFMQNIQYAVGKDSFEMYYGNVKSGQSFGAELTYKHRLADRFEISADMTYTYAAYDKFIAPITTFSDTNKDYSNNKIINTPEYTARVAANYWFLSGFYIRVEDKYVGPMFFDYGNILEGGQYNLLGGTLGWENKNYAVDLFVNNALNEVYVKGAQYSVMNDAGQTMADICKTQGTACPRFDWRNVVLKNMGDPIEFGIRLAGRF